MKTLCIAGGEAKRGSCCGTQYGSHTKKLNTELHDPAIPLPNTYIREQKAGSGTDFCAPMFTAASFTVCQKVQTTSNVH